MDRKQEIVRLQSQLAKIDEQINELKKQYPSVPTPGSFDLGAHESQMRKVEHDINTATSQLAVLDNKPKAKHPLEEEFIDHEERENEKDELKAKQKQLAGELEELKNHKDYYLRYKGLADQQKYFQDKIKLLQDAEKLSMEGTETKKTPFGPQPIPINHLLNLKKSTSWQSEFCKQHELEMGKNEDDKLQFVFKDTKETLEATRGMINLSYNDKSDFDKLVPATVELYLKSIEGKAIANHKITSSNPKLLAMLEQSLAEQLSNKNIKDTKINGKSVAEVMDSEIPLERKRSAH